MRICPQCNNHIKRRKQCRCPSCNAEVEFVGRKWTFLKYEVEGFDEVFNIFLTNIRNTTGTRINCSKSDRNSERKIYYQLINRTRNFIQANNLNITTVDYLARSIVYLFSKELEYLLGSIFSLADISVKLSNKIFYLAMIELKSELKQRRSQHNKLQNIQMGGGLEIELAI